MKIIQYIVFALLFIAGSGCEKDPPAPVPDEKEYVPGELLVKITSNADAKTVFDTLNHFDLYIAQMTNFYYHLDYPADSVSSLINLFNQKPYINYYDGMFQWEATTVNISYSHEAKKIEIFCSEFDMTTDNQADFLTLIDSLNMIPVSSNNRWMVLKVPVGMEEYWVDKLKKYPFVKSAEWNYIYEIKFYTP